MMRAVDASAEPDLEAVQAARIVESVTGNAWATDPEGRFTYVTPAALAFLDLTLDELNAPSTDGSFAWMRVIHPDDYTAAAAAWLRSLQTGEPYVAEHRMLRDVGVYVRGRSSGRPLRDGSGRISGWYGTVIDIGDSAGAVEWFADVAGPSLEGRTAAERLFSLGSIHPDDQPAAAMAAARAFWTGVPQVMRYRERQPDGAYRWTETRSESGCRLGVTIDVLETRVEEPTTLATDPAAVGDCDPVRAARIIENLFGNGWAFDAHGAWIYLPLFAQTTLGLTPADLNGSLQEGDISWKRLLHPDEYDRVASKWRRCLETGEHYQDEFRIRRATGVYAWARSAARPSRDAAGRITGWYGTSIDIDVYRKTVETLLERERELSQLVDMVPSHLWRLTPEGRPTYFNRRMIDFIGLDLHALADHGQDRLETFVRAVVHPDDADVVAGALRHSLETGTTLSMRYRLRRADGVYRWMSSRAEPMRDQAGRIIQWYGLCHDIDDQIHAEEALRKASERLGWAAQSAQLAELSASIAHEVNQPLAAIVANSHACHRWLSCDPPNLGRAKLTAERITRDANAAADIVSRVRALFRRAPAERETTSLEDLIIETRDIMADELARHRIQVAIDIPSSLPPLALDRVQIQQVLINLMRNGMEAIEPLLDRRLIRIRVRRKDETVLTSVSDCGPGLALPEQIFEPFFTTKEQGMGMGLAICRSIVESHGGRMWAEKNEPHGAIFAFNLPIDPSTAP